MQSVISISKKILQLVARLNLSGQLNCRNDFSFAAACLLQVDDETLPPKKGIL
jgi:hypothetical protein